MKFNHRLVTPSVLALALATLSSPALAQDAAAATDQTEGGQIEDIVVTAQKREQRLQDVPISVAAFGASTLEKAGVVTTADLPARVPGFVAQERTGSFVPYLRGVGSVDPNPANESIVSTYVDGVYMVSMPAGLMALANIQRLEVLKGPQGTLFGRNSVGGVINIITKTPSQEPHANFEIGYGNFETVNAKAYVSGGLTSNLSADVAVAYQDQGNGWGRNLDNGEDVGFIDYESARGKLYLDLDETRVTLAADYSRTQANASVAFTPYFPNQVLADGRVFQGGFYDDAGTEPSVNDVKQSGVSLRVEHDFGFANLLSISAYRYGDQLYTLDQDNTPLTLLGARQDMKTDDFTQEFQLTSGTGSPISWIAGLFYLHHDVNPTLAVRVTTPGGLVSSVTDYHQITTSMAGYGQVTVPLVEGTNFTAGLRYTSDKQRYKKNVNGVDLPGDSERFNKLTWRLALDHKINDDVMVYASYNRGFKSGLWNITIAAPSTTDPEVMDAYEIGFKSDLFDRTLRLNAAVFHYDYKNMQYNIVVGGVAQVQNAASSKIQGLDFDGSIALSRELRVDFGGVWSWKREYSSFPSGVVFVPRGTPGASPAAGCVVLCPLNGSFSGNTILLAPKWSLNGALDYTVPTSIGEIALNLSASYSSKLYRTIDNRLSEPKYAVVNSSVKWTDPEEQLSVTAWVKNLTKTEYHSFGAALNYGYLGAPAAPRTYGVSLGYRF